MTFKLGGADAGPSKWTKPSSAASSRTCTKTRKSATRSAAGAHGKTVVMGMLDRELRQVRAKVVPNVKRETLQREVLREVKHGSKVYTDEHVGYDNLHSRFVHDVVNHATEYVNGQVHTNGIENFWSLLKRTLNGTYVAVEPFHLDRYVDEQVFRFNNRRTKDNPLERCRPLHVGCVADCRKAADLRGADRQGGRNDVSNATGRSAGSAFPLLRFLLASSWALISVCGTATSRFIKSVNLAKSPVSFSPD